MSRLSVFRAAAHCVRTLSLVVIDLLRLACLATHSRSALAAENLFLRKQLALFQERKVKPRRADDSVRWMMAALSRMFPWGNSLVNVKPNTLTRLHRKGFRLFWRWTSKPSGRPRLPKLRPKSSSREPCGLLPGHPHPRVINVDGNPSYPKVIMELKREHKFGCRCRCRTCPSLNNIVEQDHRAIKRRVNASQGFRSFEGAWRTIQGYEVLHMIRKGQVRWLRKEDVVGQVQFINETLGLKAA